jgi:hypothetical protein
LFPQEIMTTPISLLIRREVFLSLFSSHFWSVTVTSSGKFPLSVLKLVSATLYSTSSFKLNNVERGPPLWSIGQSSWLQIQRSGFDSRGYQIFWEVVGLEWGPVRLMSTIEVLLERKSSGSVLEIREYGGRDPSRWLRGTLCPQKLALTSPTSGGRSVGIVHSRTQATEFSFSLKVSEIAGACSMHGEKRDTTCLKERDQ